MDDKNWHSKKIDNLLVDFDTPDTGLSTDEANVRLDKYGQNKLKEPEKTSAFIRFISQYNESDMLKVETPFHVLGTLDVKPKHRFFVVTEWANEWEAATSEILNYVKEDKIRYKETITNGFENAPQALRDVLTGKNFGKQIIEI